MSSETLVKNLLKFDDFAPDAEQVRQSVIAQGFTTETGPDGAIYTGINKTQMPRWFERIADLRKKAIIPRLSCFRLNLKDELPHSWVHSDDICAKWASVLYLNEPDQCRGGTAFWKHLSLGIDRLPSVKELGDEAQSFYEMMTQEWKHLDRWTMTGIMPMKFNRFITYPTCYFHSRFPFEGFGTGPADGRLIWICFYDIEGEA